MIRYLTLYNWDIAIKINTFATHFADITDPRQLGKVEHKLFDIILLTISAVVSGAEGWEGIEMFGEERLDWLQGKSMKNGVNSIS